MLAEFGRIDRRQWLVACRQCVTHSLDRQSGVLVNAGQGGGHGDAGLDAGHPGNRLADQQDGGDTILGRSRQCSRRVGHGVTAGLADRRQNVLEHPTLKPLGSREFAVHDQPEQVGFGNDAGFLLAPQAVDDGVAFHHPTAVLLQCINRISVAEYDGYIFADKPYLTAVSDYCANGMVVELKGNDRAYGHSSESMERVKDGLPASTVRAAANCCCSAGGQFV